MEVFYFILIAFQPSEGLSRSFTYKWCNPEKEFTEDGNTFGEGCQKQAGNWSRTVTGWTQRCIIQLHLPAS